MFGSSHPTGRECLLAHQRVRREHFPEDRARELEHLRTVVVTTQRRRRGHRRHPPQRVRRVLAQETVRLVLFQHQPKTNRTLHQIRHTEAPGVLYPEMVSTLTRDCDDLEATLGKNFAPTVS